MLALIPQFFRIPSFLSHLVVMLVLSLSDLPVFGPLSCEVSPQSFRVRKSLEFFEEFFLVLRDFLHLFGSLWVRGVLAAEYQGG